MSHMERNMVCMCVVVNILRTVQSDIVVASVALLTPHLI